MRNVHDLIFFLGSFIFVLALIPSLIGEAKPELGTSLVTGSVLTIFAFNYLSMKFWWSSFMSSITAICWFLLAIQAM